MRSTGLTYPNGTAISTAYTGTHAGYLSRPDQVKEGSSVIASMHCLGLGTLVGLNYDGASNLNLTYEGGTSSDAGDQYTGLDRFGRIVETIWIKGSAEAVQAVYGRNRASSILWRRDDEASSTIAMDAFYTYDGLQQVTAWKRGNLSPNTGPPYTGVTSKKQGEDFTYDQTGNCPGDVSDNPNFTQSRTHNKANQIASITGPSGVIQPLYDAAGNMTRSPSPAAWNTAYAYKWDAWNRLVEIKQGSTVVGAYKYDAMTRRTRKTVGGVTRDIYYDRQWRSVEEKEGGTVKVQHTWSPIDRWTLIRRKRNASGSTLNETLFCLRDNLDPVAIADTSGNVEERYNYDAFGTVRIMNASYGVKSSSSYNWNFLYHGEFIDEESALYNYGYRYYDPQLGRWLSRDPIGEEGGMNLYAFARNDSPNILDHLGLKSFNEANIEGADDARQKTEKSVQKSKDGQNQGPESRREYCGLICKCKDEYKPTPAHSGPTPRMEWVNIGNRIVWRRTGIASCDPTFDYETEKGVSCESVFGKEWKMVAAYHSHPTNSSFSESDWFWPELGYPLGLVTPDGKVSILTPGGKVEEIRGITK